MDLLQAGMETIVIASSDSDFSALSVRLRNAGVNVVGMGTEKSNALWRTACSSFIVLDHPAPAPKPQSAPPAEAAAPAAAESAPEPARKAASARRQARPATTTHKERMSIIQQFIEKRLDQSGGRLQVDPLFSGLNKLPEYKTDRQGSGRKPLNYLSSTFAEIFQFVRSADGKTWVSRVGTDPLPAGVEPAGEGVAEESEVAEAEEAVMEPEEAVMEVEEAVAEAIPVEGDAAEDAEESAEGARPALAQRLVDGGMDAGVAERIAPLFERNVNLRAAYNEIRKIYGNSEGRAYYHQAKAVIDAAR